MSGTLTHALSAVIDECNHDLFEQETACADGFCPICATAEITRLKGEAESWEKVFDRTCELLAEAKEQLRLCNVDQFTTAAELAEATVKNSLTVQRPWVGLTGPEVDEAYGSVSDKEWAIGGLADARVFFCAIESKLREKNT